MVRVPTNHPPRLVRVPMPWFYALVRVSTNQQHALVRVPTNQQPTPISHVMVRGDTNHGHEPWRRHEPTTNTHFTCYGSWRHEALRMVRGDTNHGHEPWRGTM